MYEMFVKVHEVSCETPGMMSKRILRHAIRTRCIVQAPLYAPVSNCGRKLPASFDGWSWPLPPAWHGFRNLDLTNLWRSPSLHSSLAMLPGHSYALLSLAAPGKANYSTAAAAQSFAHSWLCTDRSDVDPSSSRRRRRCEEGVLGKTVWRWLKVQY